MSKKQRRIIFYICILIFIISSPLIILYSFGWRVDFKNFKLLPSGALYLKTNQTNIKVYLDNKLKKEGGNLPIFNSIFIKNLAPRVYDVKIEKNDYLIWKKRLKIEPELVTEAANIILIPKDIKPEIIAVNTMRDMNFLISKNNKNIYWLSDSSVASPNNNYLELNSFNLESLFLGLTPPTSTKKIIFPNQKILKNINLVDVSWDNNNFLLKANDNIWFFYDSKKNKVVNLNKILEQILPKLINIEFYPFKNYLLIFTYNNLYEMNLENLTILPPKLKNILYYKIFKDSIYFISDEFNLSKISIYDRENKIENIMSVKDLIYTKLPVFHLEFNENNKVALIINSALYLIDEKNKTIKPIKDGVILTKFSNDNKKLAFTTKDNDLFIYYLENIIERQPNKLTEQLDKIINFGETPINIFWHSKDEHIYLQLDDKLIFTEIDNRDQVNYYSIINGNITNSYFNNKDGYIYLNIDSKIVRMKIK